MPARQVRAQSVPARCGRSLLDLPDMGRTEATGRVALRKISSIHDVAGCADSLRRSDTRRAADSSRITPAMRQPKRKWSKVSSAERRLCEAPGCTVLAREHCKRLNCDQQFCEEHKGSHSETHTLQSKNVSRLGRFLEGPRREVDSII
jgi:hypothetical protein